MDNLKDKYFPVLDHGFCAVKDFMGSDDAIVEMARCSYGAGTKTPSDNRSLIRTLMRERHTSPFERCEIVLHIGLPIVVARQLVRHRTCSLNEYSGRFSIMPVLFYEPERQRHNKQSQTNKQGSAPSLVGDIGQTIIKVGRNRLRAAVVEQYKNCLQEDLTRELARIDLPLSTYTYWYWKMDLHNLLHFLKLRLDSHAQWEIQQYARVIAGMVKTWLPYTWEAFNDYILNGMSFSLQEQQVLSYVFLYDSRVICRWERTIEELKEICVNKKMSKREINTFIEKIKRIGRSPQYQIEDLDLTKAKTPEFYQQMIQENAIEV